MGFVYDELIPASVLLNNPGITKEEFVELLSEIKVSTSTYNREDPWDIYSIQTTRAKFGFGMLRLYKLANFLGIKESDDFKKSLEPTIDENNLWLSKPYFSYWLYPDSFHVYLHYRNKIRKEKIIYGFSYYELEESDFPNKPPSKHSHIWFSVFNDKPIGVVKKIITKKEFDYYSSEQYKMINFPEQDFLGSDPPQYYYSCLVTLFFEKREILRVSSLEKAVEKFPQFHPDYVYNWKKTKGNFLGFGTEKFCWKNKNGKYYFDEKTFDKIPASFRCNSKRPFSFGYTDLIITAEAIKKKAWKLFSYGGTMHTENFLAKNKDVNEKIRKAIWDSHTSIYAKEKNMTVKEFLRSRILY